MFLPFYVLPKSKKMKLHWKEALYVLVNGRTEKSTSHSSDLLGIYKKIRHMPLATLNSRLPFIDVYEDKYRFRYPNVFLSKDVAIESAIQVLTQMHDAGLFYNPVTSRKTKYGETTYWTYQRNGNQTRVKDKSKAQRQYNAHVDKLFRAAISRLESEL